MSHQLINLNPDLMKLKSKGLGLEVRGGNLLVHHIPYLNSQREICTGTLLMSLTISGTKVQQPSDHTAYWVGDKPYCMTGEPVPSLINSERKSWNEIPVNYLLSCKPNDNNGKYLSYYDKVMCYYQTIAGPAFNFNREACEKLKAIVETCDEENEESVFCYIDTNSSRAGIASATNRFRNQKVAIVGIGGTGSYLLDFISKLPVERIDIYDDDRFNTHNAFRSPGAPSIETLDANVPKVEYFKKIYSNMYRNIYAHNVQITDGNLSTLKDATIVFLCVDSVKARNLISRYLMENSIPFVDSGLGLVSKDETISGQIRVTFYDGQKETGIKEAFGSSDIADDDIYKSNIQIAELNSIAASLMVCKWKRFLGFYHDGSQQKFVNDVYNVDLNKIFTE